MHRRPGYILVVKRMSKSNNKYADCKMCDYHNVITMLATRSICALGGGQDSQQLLQIIYYKKYLYLDLKYLQTGLETSLRIGN